MKKILIALIFITFSTTIYSQNNWWQATKPDNVGVLRKVFFLNENLGWIAGADGTILRTTDGGYSWKPSDEIPIDYSVYSVFFVDENIGYAGCDDDILLKSTNGGLTWNTSKLDTIGGKILSIYFSDENNGWILYEDTLGGQILHTTDGAINWSVQVAEANIKLKAMDFYSPNHGVCAGGSGKEFAIYYTLDGQTWTKSPRPSGLSPYSFKADLYDVSFGSENVVNIVGKGMVSQASNLLHSDDSGANWTFSKQPMENQLNINLYGVDFKDELNGMAVGGDSYKGGVLYKTVDGGILWEEVEFPFGFVSKSIKIINNNIWIVGEAGNAIAISKNYGETWELNTNIVSTNFYAISCIAENTIVAAGDYGAFIKSTDNGINWSSSYVADKNVSPTVNDLFFLNENIGYAAQNYRTVAKTTDGGKNWHQIMKDTSVNKVINYGVQFLDENIGFVVGRGAVGVSAFHKTIDGGKTWITQIGTLPNELNSLCFFNENDGFVAGNKGSFALTNDGGESWNIIKPINSSNPQHDYNDIKFYNDSFGLAGGDSLIITTNSGKTWNFVKVDGLTRRIAKIEIVDELTWYLINERYIYKTSDGGITWTDIIDQNLIAQDLTDLTTDINSSLWVAGKISTIYSTSPDVDVKYVKNNLPSNFILEQNYPNPFNPSTKINYSIPSNGYYYDVLLKVYNVLGQEIATLVNEKQNAGTYEVEFNASKLTSGIYIYTLQSAGNLESRKMLLIK